MRRLVCVLVMTVVSTAAPAHAQVPTGGDAVEACKANGGSPKQCRSLQAFLWGTATWCRHATDGLQPGAPGPGFDEDACSPIDGRVVSEAAVAGHENGWIGRALHLQRGLDDPLPLAREQWTHTHNSFNASAYLPTLSGSDPNQLYSLVDQLRMGIRALELDLHWFPSPHADPADGGKAPLLCHGTTQGGVHIGCTAERHLRDGLREIRGWLDGHPDEVVMLYLENQLDNDPVAHEAAVRTLDDELGDLVYKPSASCASLPYDTSRAEIRTQRRRVLLTGNCGPGSWGSWVHERGPRWNESKSAPGDDYTCTPQDGVTWRRTYEDSTWLSQMVDGTGLGGPGQITPSEAAEMARCGLNMPGLDQLQPFDARLANLVWSWAPDEPSTGECAYQDGEARLRSNDCGRPRAFACRNAGGWFATVQREVWSEGTAACAAEGGTFAVPRTGPENAALAVHTQDGGLWLNYANLAGAWTPEAA